MTEVSTLATKLGGFTFRPDLQDHIDPSFLASSFLFAPWPSFQLARNYKHLHHLPNITLRAAIVSSFKVRFGTTPKRIKILPRTKNKGPGDLRCLPLRGARSRRPSNAGQLLRALAAWLLVSGARRYRQAALCSVCVWQYVVGALRLLLLLVRYELLIRCNGLVSREPLNLKTSSGAQSPGERYPSFLVL